MKIEEFQNKLRHLIEEARAYIHDKEELVNSLNTEATNLYLRYILPKKKAKKDEERT